MINTGRESLMANGGKMLDSTASLKHRAQPFGTLVESLLATSAGWSFEPRKLTAVQSAATHEKHFEGDKLEQIVQAAVRELTQNSLDAKDRDVDGPVTLKFTRKTYSREEFDANFMQGLDRHLTAAKSAAKANKKNILDNLPSSDLAEVPALLIEDYGTYGLRGSIDLATWREEQIRNFGLFFLSFGISGKANGAGGRHGIGKGTIPMLSELRGFIGVSHRVDHPNLVGYGQISTFPHQLPGEINRVYDTYGLYGQRFGEESLPFQGESAKELSDRIGFDRDGKNGLSLFVPFPRAEVTDDAIIRAAIKQCFFQICMGMLVVRVVDIDGVERIVDKDTITAFALSDPETASLATVIDHSILATDVEQEHFTAQRIEAGKTCFDDTAFSETQLDRIRELWNAGEPVDVRFEVPVHPRGGLPMGWGKARILLRQITDGGPVAEVSVRGGVTVYHRTPVGSKHLGLFMACEDDMLSRFLGDSEDVAHNRWILSQVEKLYFKADPTIRRVWNAFRDLLTVINGVEEGREVNAFDDLLYTTRTDDTPTPAKRPPIPLPNPSMPEDEIVAARKPFLIHAVSDGVTITRNPSQPGDYACEVELFYARNGTTKSVYNPADFDLSDTEWMSIETRGDAVVENASGNTLTIVSASPESAVTIRGFDVHRTVTVKLNAVEKE